MAWLRSWTDLAILHFCCFAVYSDPEYRTKWYPAVFSHAQRTSTRIFSNTCHRKAAGEPDHCRAATQRISQLWFIIWLGRPLVVIFLMECFFWLCTGLDRMWLTAKLHNKFSYPPPRRHKLGTWWLLKGDVANLSCLEISLRIESIRFPDRYI